MIAAADLDRDRASALQRAGLWDVGATLARSEGLALALSIALADAGTVRNVCLGLDAGRMSIHPRHFCFYREERSLSSPAPSSSQASV